jgi:hypothetical protein
MMRSNRQKLSFLITLLLSILAFSFTPVLAKGGGTMTHEIVPVYAYGFIPCGSNHFELVTYSGNLNIVSHVNEVNGKYHYNYHINGQGLEGYGWFGGTEYQVVYINQNQKNIGLDSLPAVNHSSITLFFISKGQGGSSNFLMEIDFHSTINANGEVVTEIGNSSFICK